MAIRASACHDHAMFHVTKPHLLQGRPMQLIGPVLIVLRQTGANALLAGLAKYHVSTSGC